MNVSTGSDDKVVKLHALILPRTTSDPCHGGFGGRGYGVWWYNTGRTGLTVFHGDDRLWLRCKNV